jgi:hypothetical protein
MKVTLTKDSEIIVNGIVITLEEGTEVGLLCSEPEDALAFCAIAKLSVDLSHTKDGVKYVAGAGGKFIAVPKEEKPEKVKEEKPKAKAKGKK